MNRERLGGNNTNYDKPDCREKREQEIKTKIKMAETAIALTAAAMIVKGALTHFMKTSEIMKDEERAKNVKKIEVESIAFHNGVNIRKEPYIDNVEPNQLASVDGNGKSVVIDYNGDVYYYKDKDGNGKGWYGFPADQLADKLLKEGCITLTDAKSLKSDVEYGDAEVWGIEDYVSVVEVDEAR